MFEFDKNKTILSLFKFFFLNSLFLYFFSLYFTNFTLIVECDWKKIRILIRQIKFLLIVIFFVVKKSDIDDQ